jgi:CubicO group peptidase (beta-lactamase class C family)
MSPRAERPDDAGSVTRNLQNLSTCAPVRPEFIYCNMMYTVATYLVEQKSGIPFSEFLHDNFFGPLKMPSTSLQPERARAMGLDGRVASGYEWDEDGRKHRSCEALGCPEGQGPRSIITSANDFVKWVKAVMNQENPITEEVYKGLVRQRSLMKPDAADMEPFTTPETYGAGWGLASYRGHMMAYHDGITSGFAARHFFLPDFNFGAVIFGNSSRDGHVATIVSRELMDEVLGVPKPNRPDWSKVELDMNVHIKGPEAEVEVRQMLCPGIESPQPHTIPLRS